MEPLNSLQYEDEDLLFNAARALGKEYGALSPCPHCHSLVPDKGWNPLQSDADAFRLMTALELECRTGSGYVQASDKSSRNTAIEIGIGPVAARRAIVRTAAEIGRSASTERAAGRS